MPNPGSPSAVVLLSGGLDSATVLAVAKSQGFTPYTMTFLYGQRHSVEAHAARQVAERTGVAAHREVMIDLRAFGGSALTSPVEVPKERTREEMACGIPITYVPARNTIFLAYALAWAEVIEAADIFLGVNAQDHSGYPDCRPEFVKAFEHLANLATRAGVEGQKFRIHAPLVQLTKAEIIRQGHRLGVDYSLTSSCYDPATDGTACGQCDSCQLRLAAFAEVGIVDPIRYRPVSQTGVA